MAMAGRLSGFDPMCSQPVQPIRALSSSFMYGKHKFSFRHHEWMPSIISFPICDVCLLSSASLSALTPYFLCQSTESKSHHSFIFIFIYLFLIYFFYSLTMLCGMCDLSSLTRDQIHTPCIGSMRF